MPSDDLDERLNALTRLAAQDGEGEAFRLAAGTLKGFAAATPEILAHVTEAIALHRRAWGSQAAGPARQTFGIEVGAGVAKLFAKAWPQGAPARTIVDVKLRLPRRTGTPETDRAYRVQIEEILRAFNLLTPPQAGDWLIPPQAIVFDAPQRLREACPPNADVTYVYGTQGPRESTRQSGPLLPRTLRLLTGDEEALLMFDAIVPQDARIPGAMAIEIGSGSTELALIAASGRTHAIALALGEARHEALPAIARAIASGDIADAANHLESEPTSAAAFLTEARQLPASGRLYINPNKDSAAMRSHAASANGAILTDAIAGYARENPTAPFAAKATILATLARAFAHTTVHEGNKGGLKEGMARFMGNALAARAAF